MGMLANTLRWVESSEISRGILLVVALYLAWTISDVLFIIFGGILIAIAFTSLISYVSRKSGLPWVPTFILSLALVVAVLGLFGYLLFSTVISQVAQFTSEIPTSFGQLQGTLAERFGFSIPLERIQGLAGTKGLTEGIFTLGTIQGIIGAISTAVFIIFLGIYFSLSPQRYILAGKESQSRKVISETGGALKWWIIGTLASMLVIGLMTTIGLLILGVRFAIVLGILAGLLEFVPYLGPILSWVPAVIIAFSQDPMLALYVTLLYLLIQSLESYIVVPIIQQKAVNLPPAYLLISEIVFGALFGFLGFLFAVPVVVAVRTAYGALSAGKA